MSEGKSPAAMRARTPAAAARPGPITASLAVVLPDEPVPVRLMNTIWADRLGVHDALTTAGNLRAWLSAIHLDVGQQAPGPATPTRRALSSVAHQSIDLLTSEDRVKLRACNAPGCVLYFVKDHPRR